MSDILDTAEDLIGRKTGVFDCSGFVSYCYEENGIYNVPHSSYQIWANGSEGDGSAGDIVCWDGHVGICDGYGNVIHSYNSNHNIRKDSIRQVSQWDRRPVKGFRRFY